MTVGGPVEALWVLLNIAIIVLSVWGLLEAQQSMVAVRALNGHGPRIVASGDRRRETFRILAQCGLLVLAIPALVRPGDTPVSFPVLALFVTLLSIASNTVGDAVDRRRLVQHDLRRDRRSGDQ